LTNVKLEKNDVSKFSNTRVITFCVVILRVKENVLFCAKKMLEFELKKLLDFE